MRLLLSATLLACAVSVCALADDLPEPQGSTGNVAQPVAIDKRAYGVLPNYRTAESSQPFQAISVKRKMTIATMDSFDGPSWILALAFSGISQGTGSNANFGQGMKGYAKRYGSSLTDQDVGNFLTEGVLPSLFREDPRFFRLGTGAKKHRLLYAATRVIITRTDHNHQTFNFAEFVGNAGVGALGNLYYRSEQGFYNSAQRAVTQIGTDALSNVLKEFWPDVKRRMQARHQK